MTRVVLGSASSGRLKVLRGAGIDPLVVVSGVDEQAVVDALPAGSSPARVTTALAVAKAESVAAVLDSSTATDCVVIGCDTMLFLDGELRGKPVDEQAALDGWRAMAGRSGQLYTGHCVIRLHEDDAARRADDHAVTTVHFASPSADDLTAYVRSGEPVAVAGGFTLDGLGGWFVDGVDGDPSAVIGLGLPLTRRLFDRVGLSITELWAANSTDG